MDGGSGKKGRRRAEDQKRASDMKARGEERTTARCPICYVVVHGDMLRAGMSIHRCGKL